MGQVDCGPSAKIYEDLSGKAYVIYEGKVERLDLQTKIQAFDVDGMMLQKSYLHDEAGDKVSSNCCQILAQNSVYLPYSYFTFIIQNRNAKQELTEDTFLLEGYNYYLDGRNVFHDFSHP